MNPEANSPADLIVSLSRSMHTGGAPADELESRMSLAALRLGVPAHFFSTPTSLFITFENEPHSTRLIRVKPAEVNLAKLTSLYQLYLQIESGQLDVAAAGNVLKEIEATNYDYGDWAAVLCFAIIGGGAGIFLSGNWTVVTSAALISLLVGILVRGFEHYRLPEHLATVTAGFVAAILANIVQHFFPAGSVELTQLASLIVLLPGLQFTVSVKELATQNLASGTSRMAGALTTFLTMIFGVVMGAGLADWIIDLPPPIKPQALPVQWSLAALLPVSLAFCVLFRARKREMPWMLLASFIAFVTVRVAGMYLSPIAASWSAALVVGVASNLFARFSNRPAAIMMMPGLLLLVPGSMGFFGLSAIAIHDDLPSGFKIVFTMLMVAVSLVAGLLVANVVCPIEKPLPR